MDMLQDPQYKTPDGSALRVWRDTAKNNFLSEREGRAIFDEVIYVEVISPGSRDSTPTFEVVRVFAPEMEHPAPKYGIKYPEYRGFIEDFEKAEGNDAALSGTPLSQWPEMTRTMVAALKSQSVFTVDALAGLPDTKLHVVGPDGRTWREKAKAYIENAKSNAYATGLAADLEREKVEKDALKTQLSELAEKVKTLEAAAGEPAKPAKPAKPDPLTATPAIAAEPGIPSII